MNSQVLQQELATEKVSVSYTMDGGPGEYRIGLIVVSTDMATERDLRHFLPGKVEFFTNRILMENPLSIERLRALGPRLTQAVAELVPDKALDVVAFSCTAGTMVMGYDEVADRIHAGRPDVPVVTPITSAAPSFERLGIRRISLLTPYVDSINQHMRKFLEDQGLSVVRIKSFCLDNDLEMAEIPPDAIYEAAIEACDPNTDGLFISSTALRAVEVIDAIEQATGKIVVSSIQALLWHALREAGYEKSVKGVGRLLRA